MSAARSRVRRPLDAGVATSRSGKKVLHLAPGHVAFDTRVFWKECRTLADAGYDVTLVAPHERDEVRDGVRVVALPRWTSRRQRFLRNPWAMAAAVRRVDADIVHFHDIEALPLGLLLAVAGRRVIYDSHEDYPRLTLDRTWIPRHLRNTLSVVVARLEQFAERWFAGVVSAEDVGAQRFRGDRLEVIRNFALAAEVDQLDRTAWAERPQRVVYVGDIVDDRGAVEMVDAMASVQTPGARLTLIGPLRSTELDARLRASPGWNRVDYLGRCDREAVIRELNRARVGIVLLMPTVKYVGGAVPVKLFEYLAAGMPVVASDLHQLRSVLEPAEAGVLVDPVDVAAIARALDTLLDEPGADAGARGRQVVRSRYMWEREAVRLLELYERVSALHPRPFRRLGVRWGPR